MANEDYITKKDLSNVTQKVMIENSRALTEPLVEEQKKGALQRLEEKADATKRYNSLFKVITNIVPTMLKGLFSFSKTLLKAPKSIFSFIFKIIKAFLLFAGIVAVFDGAISTFRKTVNAFRRFGKILDFLSFKKLGKMKSVQLAIQRIKDLGQWFVQLGKNIKALALRKLRSAGRAVFGVVSRIGNIFSSIVKAARKYNKIFGIFGKIGMIFRRIFLPLTILFSVFDFVGGFMKGYKEGGIIKGIKEGFNSLFDGLVGGLLRILAWIPAKLTEWLGLENLSKAITQNVDQAITAVKGLFGGVIDLVKAIFTFDGKLMMKALGDIWTNVKAAVMVPFNLIEGFVKDTFGGLFKEVETKIEEIKTAITGFFDKVLKKAEDMLDFINPFSKKTPEKINSQMQKASGSGIGGSMGNSIPGQRNSTSSINAPNINTPQQIINNINYNINNGSNSLMMDAMKLMNA